jgi:hypothetical protein
MADDNEDTQERSRKIAGSIPDKEHCIFFLPPALSLVGGAEEKYKNLSLSN